MIAPSTSAVCSAGPTSARAYPKQSRRLMRAWYRPSVGSSDGGLVMHRSIRTRCECGSAPAAAVSAARARLRAAREPEEELRAVHVEGVRLDPRTDSPVLSLVEDGERAAAACASGSASSRRDRSRSALEREPIVAAQLARPAQERARAARRARCGASLVTELRESTFYARDRGRAARAHRCASTRGRATRSRSRCARARRCSSRESLFTTPTRDSRRRERARNRLARRARARLP